MNKKWLHDAVLTLLIAFGLGSAGNLMAAAPTGVLRDPTSVERADIAAILSAQDRAWSAGDADAYTESVLPDVLFTNVVGAYSIGKAPLLAQVQKIFATIYKGSRAKTSIVHIALLGNDVALVDTISTLTGFSQAADESVVVNGATYSRLQETLALRDGSWWIASIHNVFIKPYLVPKGI